MDHLHKELEEKLSKISHVYTFAHEAYLYTEYFHHPETKEELDLVAYSPLAKNLNFIMHMMFRTLITEVAKLFSNSQNDKFRLYGFIESLSPTGHYRKIGFSTEKIDHWKQEIGNNKTAVDNVLLIRSKLYAHSDNPLGNYNDIDISFKEIKALLDIAYSVINGVYNEVFNAEFASDPVTFDRSRFILLKLLAKAEKQRQDELTQKALASINAMHKLKGE